jgi:hypothetical protein
MQYGFDKVIAKLFAIVRAYALLFLFAIRGQIDLSVAQTIRVLNV